jgi:hypothetical protein
MHIIRDSVAGQVPNSEWLSDVIKVAPTQGKTKSILNDLMGMNRKERRAYMSQRRKAKK